MKGRGCCLGCSGVLLLAVALLIAGVVAAEKWAGLLHEHPRVDTAAQRGDAPALQIRLDPVRAQLSGILAEALEAHGGILAALLPHELSLVLAPQAGSGHSDFALLLSLRRGAPLLEQLIADPAQLAWFPQQEVVAFGLEAPGLWTARSHLPIDEALLAQVRQWWPVPCDDALAPQGGHALEVVIDNRDGRTMLALDALLVDRKTDPDEIVVMKAPFDIESAQRLPGLFRRLTSARITADPAGDEDLHVSIEVVCPDAQAAEGILFFLFTLRDTAYRQLIERNVIVEGDFTVAGATITGDFTVRGYRTALVRYLTLLVP